MRAGLGGHPCGDLVDVADLDVEPVNLYLAVTLPPGSRKSAVFKAL
jgi:hypothetical protein